MNKTLFFKMLILIMGIFIPLLSFATNPSASNPLVFGIRYEFIIFAFTLLGIAIFHNKTMIIALTGLIALLIFKIIFRGEESTAFSFITHIYGNKIAENELITIVNLAGLLFGYYHLRKHMDYSFAQIIQLGYVESLELSLIHI